MKKRKEMFQTVSEEIVTKALSMYMAKNTRYLRKAQIDKKDDAINLIASFAITNCCYAPDSGHFNAVEAIICLNQMVYVALLGGIDKKMLPFYDGITPDDFCQHWQKVYHCKRKTPGVSSREIYISMFENIKFKKLINSSSFFGKITLRPMRKMGDKVYAGCYFGFGNNEECADFIGNIKGVIPLFDF